MTCRREKVEMLVVGCVLCVLSAGANCDGWVVCLGWGEIAGSYQRVLCLVMYYAGAVNVW